MKEITFKTKFDLGQTAVAFDSSSNKLQTIEIVEIQFDMDGCNSYVWYRDKHTRDLFRENNVFSSREEFIAQL